MFTRIYNTSAYLHSSVVFVFNKWSPQLIGFPPWRMWTLSYPTQNDHHTTAGAMFNWVWNESKLMPVFVFFFNSKSCPFISLYAHFVSHYVIVFNGSEITTAINLVLFYSQVDHCPAHIGAAAQFSKTSSLFVASLHADVGTKHQDNKTRLEIYQQMLPNRFGKFQNHHDTECSIEKGWKTDWWMFQNHLIPKWIDASSIRYYRTVISDSK